MSANFGGAERDLSMTDFSYAADISADGRTLLVGEFGTVEANNGTYLRPLDGAPLRVGAGLPLALSPDGTRVAVLLPEDKLGVAVYSTASAEQPAVDLGPLTRRGCPTAAGTSPAGQPQRVRRCAKIQKTSKYRNVCVTRGGE